ncbi:hypothetical protein [Bernardetia sp. MNP-M8]|uniref:hypothetical protein n=1 Tax=Bernardetia sp. MNP-M8 TaxID=3127470 RepID=UPI0030D05569
MDISIPQHCFQEWDKMKPKDGGRFCDICKMFVVDFSQMTREEIIDYKQKTEGKLCAKISTYQLTTQSTLKTNLYLNSLKSINRELADSFNYLFLQGQVIDGNANGIPNVMVNFSCEKGIQTITHFETTTSTNKDGEFSFYLPISIENNQYNKDVWLSNRNKRGLFVVKKEGFEEYITDYELRYEANNFVKLQSNTFLRKGDDTEIYKETVYGMVYQKLESFILSPI